VSTSSAKSSDEVVVEDVDSDEDTDADDDDETEEKRQVNVYFLPAVDFKILYHCEGVTETTKESIWKYLQMVLFLIMKSVKSSAAFGETEDLFAGVDEKELQSIFLSDQIAYKILDEEADLSILKVAEEKVKYLKTVIDGK
jgi:hypothetical protein